VKLDTLEPTLYALVLAVLLGVRVYDVQMTWLRQRARNG
jgi:DMSO/TMAO reductase YedYZ heme-binding membrane subunit